jgi:DNA repair protein RadC
VQEIRVVVVRDRRGRVSAQAIETPEDAFKALASKAKGLDREHFWVIHLSARNMPIALETVSVGTLSASLVHPREVFKAAIVAGAAAIIVAHNHPSSDMEPSTEDAEATRRLVRSGELIGIPVIDHLILDGRGSFSSLKQTKPRLFS